MFAFRTSWLAGAQISMTTTTGPIARVQPTVVQPAVPQRLSPHPAPTQRSFREDIAGLRAVAVLLVVIGHAGVPLLGGGCVGVDVFFVISGFLITAHLAGELLRTGRISFARFYARRMVRLLPASILVVLATLAAAWYWASPMFTRAVAGDALASVAYLVNVRLAVQGTNYMAASDPPSPLQHFWSLAVEEQFYLFWPLILMLGSLAWFRRGGPSLFAARTVLVVLGVVSLGISVWLTDHNQPWAYFGLQARAWELAVGALIALSVDRLNNLPSPLAAAMSWCGLAAIVGSAVWFTDVTPFPGVAALLPVGGAALLIAAGCSVYRGGAESVLRLWPMQQIGRLSYSWYLWHWPVLILAPYALGREPGTATNLALVVAALAPAYLSLVLVEDRVRFHRAFRDHTRAGLSLGLALSLVTAGAAVVILGLPATVEGRGVAVDTAAELNADGESPAEKLTALIAASAATTTMPANLTPPVATAKSDIAQDDGCISDIQDTELVDGCDRHGAPDGGTTVVLFGDSHARQWFDAVDAVARERDWRLAQVTKGGCPASSALVYKAKEEPYVECMEWREKAIAHIISLEPSIVIMTEREVGAPPQNFDGEPGQAWAQAWQTTIGALEPTGAQLVWLADTPYPQGTVVPECVATNPLGLDQCHVRRTGAFDIERRAAATQTLQNLGVIVIDPTPWFCTDSVCPVVIGNTLVYRDNNHVSTTYIKLLTPLLADQLPA
ncbi:acyltransferase family protein [Solwaraspora sp. WMMD406]|uniref:acyltransferase family protein n=1 Tax=Solwaraspora sp. WMMD406 TaxID=3016095 RepID=UPI0024170995|nr:acyltransferase family protein [Solwaraspora sp. WMMD406]MDG4768339.1 acyltransferase family protein [Solwaraspora sp. WMMD406]